MNERQTLGFLKLKHMGSVNITILGLLSRLRSKRVPIYRTKRRIHRLRKHGRRHPLTSKRVNNVPKRRVTLMVTGRVVANQRRTKVIQGKRTNPFPRTRDANHVRRNFHARLRTRLMRRQVIKRHRNTSAISVPRKDLTPIFRGIITSHRKDQTMGRHVFHSFIIPRNANCHRSFGYKDKEVATLRDANTREANEVITRNIMVLLKCI